MYLPAVSPGRPLAQGTPATEQNSSSSRQSYFGQNIITVRQNDEVLTAPTPEETSWVQGTSVAEKRSSRQSNESKNKSNSRQNYGDLLALSPGETPRAQGTPATE